MNRCRNPEHPHCTVWVMPDEQLCAHGHVQPVAAAPRAGPAGGDGPGHDGPGHDGPGHDGPGRDRPGHDGLPSGFAAISALRARRLPAAPGTAPQAGSDAALQRPQLHISGFDPRAAGGRQAIRLDLRGMPMDCAAELRMLVRSGLRLGDGDSYAFRRTSRGDWRPVFLEFSSRGVEHGQYRIDIELHSRHPQQPGAARTWSCSPVILVPRPDASLGEIHQTFLSSHKNVRVTAEDAGIARVQAPGGASLDIDVSARDGAIAQLDLRDPRDGGGKLDLGFSTIAWDEDLIEIDVPLAPAGHPCPASSACLVHAEPDSSAQRHLRLFALDECVLGRFEETDPEADLLLLHHGEHGEERGGLTRRLSGRHALIRAGRHGFEIEDVSRYGLLLDGVWPGKHAPVPLRLGMRIALTASIRGVVELEVTALLPHGVILHRLDAGAQAEAFCILAPDTHPGRRAIAAGPRAAGMPLLFHRDGGFWHLDPASGTETPLAPGVDLDRLSGIGRQLRFSARPYPEKSAERRAANGAGAAAGAYAETYAHAIRAGERRRARPAAWLGN